MRKIQFKGYGVELPKNTVNFKEQIRYRISGDEKQISLAVSACQKALKNANINSVFYQDVRVTAKDSMEHILSVVGKTRLQIEAEFCKGLANTPMLGTKVSTISGNFITAKPFGVRDGIDYQLTGEVRRIDAGAIKHNLDCRHVVILDSF